MAYRFAGKYRRMSENYRTRGALVALVAARKCGGAYDACRRRKAAPKYLNAMSAPKCFPDMKLEARNRRKPNFPPLKVPVAIISASSPA